MSKRYYKLSEGTTGKPLTSYARNQPHIEGLVYLEEPTEDNQIWDGKNWIDSPNKESIESLKLLIETDSNMIRVVEDIINYIVDGTPIPQDAKDKINNRKALRNKIK